MKTMRETKREAVRNAILSAGKETIESEGLLHLSIRKIAKKIGYSPGSIYSYYPSKEDLLNALISTKYMEMMESIDAAQGSDPTKTFEAKMKAYIAFALSNRDYYEAMMLSKDARILKATSILQKPDTLGMNKLIASIEAMKTSDPTSLMDFQDTARFIWTSVFGLIIRIITEGIVSEEKINPLIDSHLHHVLLILKGDSHA
jgi:AcrR family transcriptional regulator